MVAQMLKLLYSCLVKGVEIAKDPSQDKTLLDENFDALSSSSGSGFDDESISSGQLGSSRCPLESLLDVIIGQVQGLYESSALLGRPAIPDKYIREEPPQDELSKLYRKLYLGDRCIRVLHLSPSSPKDNTDIHGSLEVVDLSTHPRYDALSYCWGDKPADSQVLPIIKIDSTTSSSPTSIPLWPNCDAAIRALLYNSLTRTIWIDALCINQSGGKEGKEEQKKQIPLMMEVYGGAEKVWIWLGAGVANRAIEWIQEEARLEFPLLAKKFKAFPDNMRRSEVIKLIKFLPNLMEIYLYKWNIRRTITNTRPAAQEDVAKSMVELLSRDWFTRMWTIQELVMASEPIALCGNKTIRWNTLHWGIVLAQKSFFSPRASNNYNAQIANNTYNETFNSVVTANSFWLDLYCKTFMGSSPVYNWVSEQSFLYTPWQQLLDLLSKYNRPIQKVQFVTMFGIVTTRLCLGLRPLNSIPLAVIIWSTFLTLLITPQKPQSQQHWQNSLKQKLPNLLHMLRTRSVTKEPDRVFALAGVYKQLGIPFPTINYEMPIGDLYWNFTRRVMAWVGNLELLTEVGCIRRLEMRDVPSWVPDWGVRFGSVVGKGGWMAAGHSKPDFCFAGEGDGGDGRCGSEIVTKGLMIDKIVEIDVYADNLKYEDHGMEVRDSEFGRDIEIFSRWLSMARQPRFHESSSSSDTKGLQLGVTERLFGVMHSETDFEIEDKNSLLATFRKWINFITDFDDTPTVYFQPPSPKEVDMRSYHDQRCASLSKSRLFCTEKNRLGKGPTGMKKGDVVALLAGLRVPMLLRKVAKGDNREMCVFQVVGAVFVDGVMGGEVWREKAENVDEIRRLVLV